jgi:membrane protein YqaA with SNARE-associated domain
MCAAMPEKAWRIALFSSLSSVGGGFLGYGIGYLAAEHAQALIVHWGYEQAFETTKGFVNTYGGLSILVSAVTPMPYKVMTITAGLFSMNIAVFLITSLMARGARFFFAAFVSAKISTVVRNRRNARNLSP